MIICLTISNEETIMDHAECLPDSDVGDSDISDICPATKKRPKGQILPEVGGKHLDIKEKETLHNENIVVDIDNDAGTDDEDLDEESIVRDVKNPSIYITKVITSSTSKNGKAKKNQRVYNSYQYCGMCKKKVSNLSQHLIRNRQVHDANETIKEIREETDEKTKKKLQTLLRGKFNHDFNMITIKKGKGEILLERRPTKELRLQDYGPCPNCFLWFAKALLKRHGKNCANKKIDNLTIGDLTTQSECISGQLTSVASKQLLNEVFSKMRRDLISEVVKGDLLITQLGNQWLEKNVGNVLKRGVYTSQILRLIGRFLIILRRIKPLQEGVQSTLWDYLKPPHFDMIVKACILTASPMGEEEDLKAPSNAIKIGYDLKRLLSGKIGLSIIHDRPADAEDAEKMLKLMDIYWETKVTKAARVILLERSYYAKKNLPLPADIQRLIMFLRKKLVDFDYTEVNRHNHRQIAEAVQAKLVIYNRRRTREMQDARLCDYDQRCSGIDGKHLVGSCSELEKKLLESQEVMTICGKVGRAVPVILPDEVMEGLRYLTDSSVRSQVGISPSNRYLFASEGESIVWAYDSVRKAAEAACLDKPEAVTSTSLRKYMATVTQVLDLKESQMQWVINHLGRTMDVHKLHYRATSDILERTQVAKILLLQDQGRLGQFKNRGLEEIDLKDKIAPSPTNINDTRSTIRLFKKKGYFANIQVPIYKKNATKRNYTKIDYCVYCETPNKSKLTAHYESKHRKRDAVKHFMSLPIGSFARKKALLKLQHEGNFKHNIKVIMDRTGELVVSRRPTEGTRRYGAEEYLPCEFCLGFYRHDCLWSHVKSCMHKPDTEQPEANYISNGHMLIAPNLYAVSEEVEQKLEKLFAGMYERKDNPDLAKTIENDQLIREFAMCLLEKIGENAEHQRQVRTNIREVGTVLTKLHENSSSSANLASFFTGWCFSAVVNAVKQLSLETDTPSVALRLGHHVKQLCLIKLSLAIRDEKRVRKYEAAEFKKLYETMWNSKVSSIAKRRKKLQDFQKKSDVPCTSDLMALGDFLVTSISDMIEVGEPYYSHWIKMAQYVLARVVLFNKRSVSEVENLKMLDYQDRQMEDMNEDILSSLSVSERAIAQRMSLIEVTGQSTRGKRKVFVLLTPSMCRAIEWLIETRGYAEIDDENPYIFANQSTMTIDGSKALQIATECCPGLENPACIRSSKLRNYLATTAQILDMDNSELKMIADHIGHNLNIHADIDHLSSSVTEKVKVAMVLVAADNGTVLKIAGKSLDKIHIDDIPMPLEYNDDWCRDTCDGLFEGGQDTKVEGYPCSSDDSTECLVSFTHKTGIEEYEVDEVRAKIKRRSSMVKRWTQREEQDLSKAFQTNINEKKNVRTEDIRNAQEKYISLRNRSISIIRSKINNIILGKCKQKEM